MTRRPRISYKDLAAGTPAAPGAPPVPDSPADAGDAVGPIAPPPSPPAPEKTEAIPARTRRQAGSPAALAAALNAARAAEATAAGSAIAATATPEPPAPEYAESQPVAPQGEASDPAFEPPVPSDASAATATDLLAGPEIMCGVTASALRECVRARRGLAELLVFRVGGELFAVPLGAVEEGVEPSDVHPLPEMPDGMVGVFSLRGRLVPLYQPTQILGATPVDGKVALIFRADDDRRIALVADDIDDVMVIDLRTLRPPPGGADADGVLLAIGRRNADLVLIVDADRVVALCGGIEALETA